MVIKDILNEYVKKDKLCFKELRLSKHRLQRIRRIVFVADSSAYSSALAGVELFEKLTDVMASSYLANEFRYSKTIVDSNTLLIGISRTGSEEDIIASINRVKAIGGKAIVMCNNKESTASKEANYVLNPIDCGFEAESFTLSLLAMYIGERHGFVTSLYQTVALRLAEMLSSKITAGIRYNSQLAELYDWLYGDAEIIACGRGIDYSIAYDFCHSIEIANSVCHISELATLNLENKKILAIISSKDSLNDIMFYLDLARQKTGNVMILTTEEVAEELPHISGTIAISGSMPIFNPAIIVSLINNIAMEKDFKITA